MQQLSRRTFLEFASLASAGLIGGCGGAARIAGSDNFPYSFSPMFTFNHLFRHCRQVCQLISG